MSMKYNIMRGLYIILGIMTLMSLSVCAASVSSFSFINPVNNSIITDNSFVLINASEAGYNDVSYGSDSFIDDGAGYWSYGGYIPSEGLNVVSVDFCVSESSCDSADLYFYVLPVSFISPVESSYTNNSFVLINVSASGYSDVSYGSDSFIDDGAGYWSYGGYIPSEGLNVVSVDFCVSEGVCTSKSVSFYYDTAAPIITVPANIVQVAPSASGDVVNYSTSADDGSAVICAPVSGSTFVVGETIVNCSATDLAGNVGTNNFTITLTYTAPVEVQSGGGGSGGSCTTQWSCGEWGACTSGGFQLRTCSYPTGSCAPTSNQPAQSQSCNYVINLENENQTLPQTNVTNGTAPGFFSGITGAVIGTNAGRWSLGVLIFLILVGLAWWIVAARKRRVALASKPIKKK